MLNNIKFFITGNTSNIFVGTFLQKKLTAKTH